MKIKERQNKIVSFAGKDGTIRRFLIDYKGNVREQVNGWKYGYFRPVSEALAIKVCEKANFKRPELDSRIFRADVKQATKYVAFINGKRI